MFFPPLQRKLFASKRRHDMELEEDDYTLTDTFLPFYSVDLCNIKAFNSKTSTDLLKEIFPNLLPNLILAINNT
jgi:hypothetical protein